MEKRTFNCFKQLKEAKDIIDAQNKKKGDV